MCCDVTRYGSARARATQPRGSCASHLGAPGFMHRDKRWRGASNEGFEASWPEGTRARHARFACCASLPPSASSRGEAPLSRVELASTRGVAACAGHVQTGCERASEAFALVSSRRRQMLAQPCVVAPILFRGRCVKHFLGSVIVVATRLRSFAMRCQHMPASIACLCRLVFLEAPF